MDTSELLEQLQLRIGETARDRDRLAEAVIALGGEIDKLEGEHRIVARLVAQFDQAHRPPAVVEANDVGQDTPHELRLSWPAGADNSNPIKVKKIKAWSRYKFVSAEWYLDALAAIASQHGRLERVLGVEMAVDGVIQSLAAAFDAAVFALTNAIERMADIAEERRTPAHLASWSKLAAEAKYYDIDLASSLSISDALIGEHLEAPQGWLAQLLVLRRRSILQDLLVDLQGETTSSGELGIEVPGRGPQPLLDYLSATRDLVAELLETIMHDVTDAKNGRLHIVEMDRLRTQAEREISNLLTIDRQLDT